MARIGLQNFKFGFLTEAQDGTPTYSTSYKAGKAISCNVSISNNDAKLYADDSLAESDSSFQSGTATLGIDDEDLVTMALLLGHQVTDGEIVRNATDIAQYVGLGRIVTKMVNNVYKYKVEFLYKVKFAEPSNDEATRGESVEFGTSQIVGNISALANGQWSCAKTFDKMSDAQAYLESFFEPKVSAEVTFSNLSGTQTFPDVDTYVGAIINVPSASEVIAPSGYTFTGWDTDENATIGDIHDTYKVQDELVTLYAIYKAI